MNSELMSRNFNFHIVILYCIVASIVEKGALTVSHRSEYTPHIFVNILLYLFM